MDELQCYGSVRIPVVGCYLQRDFSRLPTAIMRICCAGVRLTRQGN